MHLTEANMISCRSEYFLYSATPKMRNCMYYPHRVGLGDLCRVQIEPDPDEQLLIAYISKDHSASVSRTSTPLRMKANSLSSTAMSHIASPLMNPAGISGSTMTGRRRETCTNTSWNAPVTSSTLGEADMVSTRCTPFSTCSKREGGKGGRTIASHRWRVGFACVRRQVERPAQRRLNVIDRSLPYITAHLNDDLSLDSLATVFCIDKYYFSKRFKERTGTTPHQYILNARLERGKFLLHTTTLPVGAISADCGFHSQSMFCAAFKRANGKSPSQYRAELSQPFQS